MTTAAQVEAKIKEIIVEQLGVDPAILTPTSKFVEDAGADSLDTVEIIMSVEDEYRIEIPDEAAAEITNLGELVAYVVKLIEQK